MKLLCTESDLNICNEIISKLSMQGIEAEIRPRNPSLFDDNNAARGKDLYEVWLLNAADSGSAEALLYPEEDADTAP